MLIALFILWTVLLLLSETMLITVRTASRTRLTELLKGRNRKHLLDRLFGLRWEFAQTALLLNYVWIILLVATAFRWVRGTQPWYLETIYVLAIGGAWFLVFGVSIPFAWARYGGEPFLARALPILDVIRRLSRPLLAVIGVVDEIVRRLAGAPNDAQSETEQIEREIMDAVSHGETSGAVHASERDMIKSVMVLDETSAGEIMTPRTNIVAIDADADYATVRELAQTDGHSRIPVYEETMDQILGVLYAKDLLGISDPAEFSLRQTMRNVTFVPETKDLVSLLREFQTNRVHIAIVLDEYGGTAGLVTIEDILEELVGEITDEHDAEPPAPPIDPIDARTTDVDARLRVEEFNEALDVSLPEDEAYDTVGGYVFSKLGRIPAVGERITEGSFTIEILEARERSINRLRIHRTSTVSQG